MHHKFLPLLVVITVICVAGCSKTNMLINPTDVFNNNEDMLKFECRGSGWGSCGYVSDAQWDSSKIKLDGIRSEYSDGQFSIFRYREPSPPTSGLITIDRVKKIVVVNITVNGEPYVFNGCYSFSEPLSTSTETSYYPNGQKKAEVEYQDDVEVSRIEWDENGNLLQ